MIEDFGIAKDDSEIAIYAGMVTSAFTFAEFSAAVIWGKLSDIFGRKKIGILPLKIYAH
jgi:MFS family permease